MGSKITIEVDPQHEGIVRRALALAEEMEQLALSAPEGSVFDTCEEAVVEKRVRAAEEVRLHKDVVTDQQQVSDTVRREEARVETEGTPNVRRDENL